MTGNDRHRLLVHEAKAPQAVRLFGGSEFEGLRRFRIRLFEFKRQDFGGRDQAASPHLLAEATQLLEIPRNTSGANDGPLTFGHDQQTFRTQLLKCLPDGHLADTERAGNITLGTEDLPLVEQAVFDQIAYPIHDLLVIGDEATVVDHQPQRLSLGRRARCEMGSCQLSSAHAHVVYNVCRFSGTRSLGQVHNLSRRSESCTNFNSTKHLLRNASETSWVAGCNLKNNH